MTATKRKPSARKLAREQAAYALCQELHRTLLKAIELCDQAAALPADVFISYSVAGVERHPDGDLCELPDYWYDIQRGIASTGYAMEGVVRDLESNVGLSDGSEKEFRCGRLRLTP